LHCTGGNAYHITDTHALPNTLTLTNTLQASSTRVSKLLRTSNMKARRLPLMLSVVHRRAKRKLRASSEVRILLLFTTFVTSMLLILTDTFTAYISACCSCCCMRCFECTQLTHCCYTTFTAPQQSTTGLFNSGKQAADETADEVTRKANEAKRTGRHSAEDAKQEAAGLFDDVGAKLFGSGKAAADEAEEAAREAAAHSEGVFSNLAQKAHNFAHPHDGTGAIHDSDKIREDADAVKRVKQAAREL
jgi:hypothetical protein